LVYYKEILAVSYDIQYAQLVGINTKLFYTLILILSSLSIVIIIKLVGLILVIALLSIPVYISKKLCNSLASMMILSSLLSIFFTIVGLALSFTYDLTSGATIILSSTFGCIFVIGERYKSS